MSEDTQETPVVETPAEVVEQAQAPVETPAEETPVVAEPTVQEATPVQSVAEAVSPVVETPAEVVEAAPARELTAFESQIEKLKATGTSEQVALIGNLEAYMEKMKPGMPVAGNEGAATQLGFWLMIKNLLTNASEGQFRNLWSIVLAFFNEYQGSVFHEAYIYRFSEHWTQSKKELDTFHRILNLIKVSADPKTREQTKKQVDLEKVVHSLPGAASQRLLGFYSKK